jgi:hypothetical protein
MVETVVLHKNFGGAKKTKELQGNSPITTKNLLHIITMHVLDSSYF